MRDQVEAVKEKIDIVDIVSSRVTLSKAGKHYKGLCPFHNEKTPSFIVSPEMQIFKCFGCGESGDVFSFLEKYEGMDFYEALKYLAQKANIELTYKATGEHVEKEKLRSINMLSAQFYHYILTKHSVGKNALSYITYNRGITNESIETFFLGYAPQVGNPLFSYLTKKKNIDPELLVKAGVTYKYNGRNIDRFRGRIIFPLYDHRGNCIALSGRILPEYQREGLGKYINSPETPIYKKRETLFGLSAAKGDIKRTGVSIVVEGELDVISSWQVGIKNIVAIKGSAVTPEQGRLLSRLANEVILGLDSDFAGNAASIKGIRILEEMGLIVKVAGFSPYKDPDEAARGDKEAYKKALKNAVSVWDFILKSIFSKYDSKTSVGKSRISKEIIPVLYEIQDRIMQSYYIRRVAKHLRVTRSAVTEQLEKFEKTKQVDTSKIANSDNQNSNNEIDRSRRHLLEKELVTLALNYKPYLLAQEPVRLLFSNHLYTKLSESISKFKKENDKFEMVKFMKSLPNELKEGITDIVLGIEELGHAESFNKNIDETIRDLANLITKEEIGRLTQELKKIEKDEDLEKLDTAHKKLALLTKKLSGLDFP